MEKVLGVVGAFLRARDREALCRWYKAHLGIAIDEQWWGAAMPLSSPDDNEGACVVFGVFPQETGHFGDRANSYMLNFRVRDLHAMLAQLRDAQCDVAERVEESEFGKFGWVTDPEGHRVELWEPPKSPPPLTS